MPSGVYVDVTIAGADDVVAPNDPADNGKALVRNSGMGKYEHAGVVSTETANTFTNTQTFALPDSASLISQENWIWPEDWALAENSYTHIPGSDSEVDQTVDFVDGTHVARMTVTNWTAGTIEFGDYSFGDYIYADDNGTYEKIFAKFASSETVYLYASADFDGTISDVSLILRTLSAAVVAKRIVLLSELPDSAVGLPTEALYRSGEDIKIVAPPFDFDLLGRHPHHLTAVVDEKKVTLSWDSWDTSVYNGSVYIWRSGDGGGSWTNTGTAHVAPDYSDSWSSFDALPGDYQYKVTWAQSPPDESYFSNIVSVTTSAAADAIGPDDLTAEVLLSTRIKLTWTLGSSNADRFELAYNTGDMVPGSENLTGSDSEFIDTSTTENTDYTYKIRAYHQGSASDWVTASLVTTPAFDVQTPRNLPPSAAGLEPGMEYVVNGLVHIA